MSFRVVVIGAGAFGGWTALELVRRGAHVTVVDAWGPGHARASSGGETRVIRASYGTRTIYTEMAARALDRWRAHDAAFDRRFFTKTGALWMFRDDDAFGRASAAAVTAAGLRMSELSRVEAARRFPQIDFDGVRSVFHEEEAGLLLARRACEHVVERVIAEGGAYRQIAVSAPIAFADAARGTLAIAGGGALEADAFVFACGPWLGTLFPDVIGGAIQPTRQEVFYFGTPAGDARFGEDALPVWLDFGERLFYGIPGNANRGFKVADDTTGSPMDPTSATRSASAESVAAAQAFLSGRFPALAGAPLIGAEVCQYESTADAHFVIDRHPAAANVWIAGGGSGHGFKMGPVVGEIVASCVLDGAAPDPLFSLGRLSGSVDAEKWI